MTNNIDLPLLRKQKRALLRAIDTAPANDKELLEGVLNLLDHIHDRIDPPIRIHGDRQPH